MLVQSGELERIKLDGVCHFIPTVAGHTFCHGFFRAQKHEKCRLFASKLCFFAFAEISLLTARLTSACTSAGFVCTLSILPPVSE
jgi:hypothetical protein